MNGYLSPRTVVHSPAPVKVLNEDYAPSLIYYSGGVNVVQKLKFNVKSITPLTQPDTNSMEMTFGDEKFGKAQAGPANDDAFESEFGNVPNRKKLKTGHYAYKAVATNDFENGKLRLKSVYSDTMPIFSSEESYYGAGWELGDG